MSATIPYGYYKLNPGTKIQKGDKVLMTFDKGWEYSNDIGRIIRSDGDMSYIRKVDVGPGYTMLQLNDILEPGDECYDDESKYWTKTFCHGRTVEWAGETLDGNLVYRRKSKVEPKEAPIPDGYRKVEYHEILRDDDLVLNSNGTTFTTLSGGQEAQGSKWGVVYIRKIEEIEDTTVTVTLKKSDAEFMRDSIHTYLQAPWQNLKKEIEAKAPKVEPIKWKTVDDDTIFVASFNGRKAVECGHTIFIFKGATYAGTVSCREAAEEWMRKQS